MFILKVSAIVFAFCFLNEWFSWAHAVYGTLTRDMDDMMTKQLSSLHPCPFVFHPLQTWDSTCCKKCAKSKRSDFVGNTNKKIRRQQKRWEVKHTRNEGTKTLKTTLRALNHFRKGVTFILELHYLSG